MLATLLVAISAATYPLRDVRDLDGRLAVAEAVAATDATEREAATLMRIAYHESRYVPRVMHCAKGTTGGGRGAFQIVAAEATEYRDACGDLETQASLALGRLRRDPSLLSYVCRPAPRPSAKCRMLARMRRAP